MASFAIRKMSRIGRGYFKDWSGWWHCNNLSRIGRGDGSAFVFAKKGRASGTPGIGGEFKLLGSRQL